MLARPHVIHKSFIPLSTTLIDPTELKEDGRGSLQDGVHGGYLELIVIVLDLKKY